jgi:cytochrome c oxidase subunit 1
MSLLIRMELLQRENHFLRSNHQLYNVLIAAHAFLMIFLTVIVMQRNPNPLIPC